MKKILYFGIVIIIVLIPKKIYAENIIDINNVLEQQKSNFGIKDFLREAENYAPDFIKELNISNIFNLETKGNIDNTVFFKKILKLAGFQVKDTLKILINILIIVLVHSVLKSLTDSLENSDISKIVYYAQYILIVTIIVSNFSDILKNIKDTIENLTGFAGILIPILVTLMMYTGNISTTTVTQPILLFFIEFISNFVKNLIIPTISIITVLVITSKITDKIQINKLGSFMKNSIVWVLGVILTLFVGVVSLEGSLTASVDGVTAKTAKAAVSTLIPVVRKSLRRWCRYCIRVWGDSKKCDRNFRSNNNYRNMFDTNYKIGNF